VLPAGAFSAVACRRRLRDRTEAGVWPSLHEILLAEPRRADLLDMNDAAVDGSHVRALKGGSHRTFTSRPRLSGQHDVTQLMPLLDAIPRSRGLAGGPVTDHGGCSPTAATTTTSTAHGSGIGKTRRVVELFFAWLPQFKRLGTQTSS
jgi:transposase